MQQRMSHFPCLIMTISANLKKVWFQIYLLWYYTNIIKGFRFPFSAKIMLIIYFNTFII